ncbi:HXXEE domain-containing protein [Sporosarcina aquimarina]|uniref:HXXEE domain-containing protein n=1 Tax=Sporosarcina aquimarina TaxID=114975 RepID=UPI00203DE2B6|nr:HXXEE domain-containing protein [Sporosarcina aquimarina]MCM3756526.1 HXXEE domain-containing protein [Sporosarcina aquimarina]
MGIVIAVITVLNWSAMPVVQRMVGLFFLALVFHLWEEGKYPGGFTEMITKTLNFTARNRHFGEIVTASYALIIILFPLFFPNVVWLSMAPMMLGILEVVAHLAAIKMFKLKRFYSPGLVTSVVLMLPISIYTIVYVVQNNLMQPISWLYAFGFILISIMTAQQIVVRMSGMKYADFLKNVRGTIFAKRK